jgi:hypothetical protein
VALTTALTNSAIAENASTTNRTKVADIAITDDALGTNSITLSGNDAESFEVIGNALYLKAGVVLNFENKASYAVTVNVADASVTGSTAVSANYTLSVTDVNEAPTAVALTTALTNSAIAENASTTNRTKVADIAITDDALGANSITLSGNDAESFEVIGNALYLKAGVALNFENKANYAVTVNVADASVTGSTAVSANYTLTIDVAADIQAPRLTSSLNATVTNLDVTSNLVFTSDQALKLGNGSISIYDLTPSGQGFRKDTNVNDQTISVNEASIEAGLINVVVAEDGKTTITINPKWDLDLSSNYRIVIDEGAFVSVASETNKAPKFEVSFATVTPGNVNTTDGGFSSDAQLSQIMNTDGTLADSKKWFDYGQIGKNGTLTFGGDLSTGNYALVVKNYAPRVACPPIFENDDINGDVIQEAYGGINTPPFRVSFDNFGLNDMFYFDSQKNNEQEQKVDQRWVPVYHNPNQFGRRLVMGFGKGADAEFANDVAAAFVAFSLEGETNAAVYNSFNAIESWQDPIFGSRTGFSGTQYASASAVIMG